MPFAGDSQAAQAALDVLLALDTSPGDKLILADNSGTAPRADGVTVVRASGEHSPARARNAGAEAASTDWILFIDADCQAPRALLDAYFAEPVDSAVGALAGEVVPARGAATLAARYAGARSFLSQGPHLANPFRPRAVAANLLVRRSAFDQLGGFYEGLRAGEDTDFCWRLQGAGWRLEPRPAARVEHRYRSSLSQLRRQWRGYAAGRAWLARRYDGFVPRPAVVRAAARVARLGRGAEGRRADHARASLASNAGRLERVRYLAIDALLGMDELAGFALSNRPHRDGDRAAQVVLVADRFPVPNDPLVELARTRSGARVEATARPDPVDALARRSMPVDYREDDGAGARLLALARLLIRHPLRSLRDVLGADRDDPSLLALAPAVLRLSDDRGAPVRALGGPRADSTAHRLARLAGRPLGGPGSS
jgi:Glycosyl transferase family group 2